MVGRLLKMKITSDTVSPLVIGTQYFLSVLNAGQKSVSGRSCDQPPRHRSPPPVYKRMLTWFPRLQVATACFSCNPPDLNFLDPYFIFMYMHYNHCHRVTAHLQLNILLLLLLLLMQTTNMHSCFQINLFICMFSVFPCNYLFRSWEVSNITC